MASSGLKNFYRQKKKGGVAKRSSNRSFAGKSPTVSLSHLVDPVPSPLHGSGAGRDKVPLAAGIGEEEDEKLRQFDMDMRYGPCIGLSRTDRWERAAAMGLNPPAEVETILLKSSAAASGCLWDGRV
ncbi:uncharacterized protein LOC121977890 [Zingiber officinale]|uniref:uncharacterized protein LOC121977890 n=1 Tax=Zingiber officinale TaxID=94328 RepID=UPI001C4B6135|nr:uncharacterized protein LOC121977890 [Zingiber officinale]